jgi:PAT family beta-lactamase induction signal transducer AmpG
MPLPSLRAIYFTPRVAVLVAIGFSAGLPYMLTSRTLKLWARDEGVDLATVGLFSLVTLPYALKFLWAPVMDRFVPPFLGRRRGWLLITQLLLVIVIAGMGFTGPASIAANITAFASLAAAVTFFSASQDIVADAYRTDVLRPSEYGPGASAYITGYRIALIATGAGAVYLASSMPWQYVYFTCAALMGVGMVATLVAPTPLVDKPPASFAHAVVEPARELILRNGWRIALVLLFIVLFKLPDYMAQAMTDPMLIDLGFRKEQIAIWPLGVGSAVTIPGAIVGGLIASRLGLARALIIFGVAQAASNAGFLVLANAGANVPVMIAVVGIEYFCGGLVAAGFVAFLMSQCNHKFTATQYALLSSLMAVSSSLGGAFTGNIVEATSYTTFFAITILAAVPGMALLVPLTRHLRRLEFTNVAASPSD